MAEKLPLIGVKATASTTDKKTKGKVVLWERNEAHPPVLDEDGNDTGRPHEALVSVDGKVHQVAETKEVRRLIGEGVLERASLNSLTDDNKPRNKGGRPKKNGLRPATEEEEDDAGLTGNVEKNTAFVPE